MVALSILFTYGLQFCVPSEIMWKRIAPHVSSMYENTAYYIMRAVMILGTGKSILCCHILMIQYICNFLDFTSLYE